MELGGTGGRRGAAVFIAMAAAMLAVPAVGNVSAQAATTTVPGQGVLALARSADGRLGLYGKDGSDQVKIRQTAAGSAWWSAWSQFDGSLRSVASDPSTWAGTHSVSFSNEDWTEEAQGVTTDGTNWYVGSNNDDNRRVYKFGPDFPRGDDRVLGVLALPANAGSHLGPPVWDPLRARIVVAVEPSNVWVIDPASMRTQFLGPLGADGPRPQGSSIPWVAVNPVDGLLYSSAFGRDDQPIKSVNRVQVYDPANGYRWVRSIVLSRPLKEVQGGHISSAGHLYLTSNASFDISAYNLADGVYGGSRVVDADPASDEEIEGLTLGRYQWGGGDFTDAAVLVLDNDLWNEDDVAIRFYRTGTSM
ncbi:hypothetical protein [Catellatospora methionotrophica]|uniref:hypothetical protein n=1 Tax=Catellatospora methionotrophica TaxID=121620 RepID=UPI003408900B